ncbi:MAG: response regulator [Micavibrio sp.]|nr:response regulator [Micavibrio sp.]|tara:strand:- start:803 stop:1633 length:831 start_codon:yes stop_codon:yes gene_type:complete
MKILVIDRDRLSTQIIQSQLQELAHEVHVEQVKNNGLDLMKEKPFHAVIFDPAPLNDPRPFVLGMRRILPQGKYPYILLCSHNANQDLCLKSGANDWLTKPIDPEQLKEKMGNADRYAALAEYMGDFERDYDYHNGVIQKSAFNQVYLSAIDRADRYGDRTFLIFFIADNFEEIAAKEGLEAADTAFQKLSTYVIKLRRQSDLLGQTGRNEYCLMLQRPVHDQEPMEAINRYHDTLQMFTDVKSPAGTPVNIRLKLVAIPSGEKMAERLFDGTKTS